MNTVICHWFGHDLHDNPDKTHYSNSVKCSRCGEVFTYKTDKWRRTFWETETWEYGKIIAACVLVGLLVLLVLTLSVGFFNSIICGQYAEMGIEARYNFWTGCMANHPEFGWLPIEEYFRTINLYQP